MLAMSTFVSPQIFLVSLLAGWLNQEQQKVLEYLQEENRVLKAQLGQRLRLSDEAASTGLRPRGKSLAGNSSRKSERKVRSRERLGGLLRFYDREAA